MGKDIVSAPVGGDGGKVDLSVASGAAVLTVSYPIEAILDKALVALEAKYPSLAAEIEVFKAAVDAELA